MSVPNWTYFDAARFERQMATTAAVKHALIITIVGGWCISMLLVGTPALVGLVMMGGGLIGWLVGNVVSNRTGHLAIAAAHQAMDDPTSAEVETTIARAMQRFTMYRTIRVMLYHQLAVLRHHRGQYDQTASICLALLSMGNMGLNGGIRTRLLLLLADACLSLGDASTAYGALMQLSASKLELPERMQLLHTQTRYELACGYHQQVIESLEAKVAVAELLEPRASAEVHRMFAEAAHACGLPHTAAWLTQRADLLLPA